MIKSARVFFAQDIQQLTLDTKDTTNYLSEVTECVNGENETLKIQVFRNEIVLQNYIHYRVVMDEVLDIEGRVFNREFTQVVVQNAYDVYVDNNTKLLITLCNKKSAERIKCVFQEMLYVDYIDRLFDLDTIIFDSSNVKKAKFANLTIQTLSSGVVKGNRVNDTQIFDEMLHNGELTNIITAYPFCGQDISMSVSNSGSLIVYTSLSDVEIVELISQLLGDE